METKKIISLYAFLMSFTFLLTAQTFESKDNSKQINIPNNTGTVNINNYLNKSDDYNNMLRQLEELNSEIKDKIEDCKALEVAKSERLEKCRQGLDALNKKQETLKNNISQFKEDVIRLAETFKNATDKSQLFQKARALFEEGKFREANFLLNSKELTALGEDGLEKTKTAAQLFLIKAQIKALDYTDPLRIDSTAFCFQQSLRYFDDVKTLIDFASFCNQNHLYECAIINYNKIMIHPNAEDWQIGNSYGSLAELHTITGNLEKALENDLKLFEVYNNLYKKDSANILYARNLAVSYEKLGSTYTAFGNLDKALKFYEEYNCLETSLYTSYPKNVEFKNGLAISYQYLGNTHTTLGNLDKALKFYEKYNRTKKELYIVNPSNVEFKNGLAISYEKLGETHTVLGNLDTALFFFKEYNRLETSLCTLYPTNVQFKNDLAISYEKLGETHLALGNLDTALEFYKERNKLAAALHAAYPTNVVFKNGLAISYSKLGETYMKLGNLKMALEFYEERNRLGKELYVANPANIVFKNGLAISYLKLGETLSALGDLSKALEFYEEYNRLEVLLYESYPTNVDFKNGLAISYAKLGEFSKDNLKDKSKAWAYFKQAEALWKELVHNAPQFIQFQKYLDIVQENIKMLER